MNKQIQITVEAAIFHGELLLVSEQRGLWSLPKGQLEPGESIEECAARVIFHDTGVIGQRFSVFTAHCVSDDTEQRLTIYVQGQYLFGESPTDGWQWHSWTAIPSPKTIQLSHLLHLYWSQVTQNSITEPEVFEEPEIASSLAIDLQRENSRVSLAAYVTAGNNSIKLASKTHNLSRGGLFLLTDAELILGQELDLCITLPNQTVIECKGRVKWRRPAYLATKHKPAGVGIELISPTKTMLSSIEDTINRYQSLSFEEKFPSITGEYVSLPRAKKRQRIIARR
jgi:ADP-ribose pyrophosphatase YjhB (NUDIX family)/Tfp pilus assembly protein PilZ